MTTAEAEKGTAHAEGSGDAGAGAGGEVKQEKQEQEREKGKEEEEEEEEQFVIEQPLLTIKEVFVYKVPPLRASSGHRAEEWGLANPVLTGFLKVVQAGNACCLRLFKPPPEGELGATPELFAECAVHLDKGRTLQVYVESVIDSSRYFVLRCEDRASGRHAYVGIGFRERSSAFDLKAVLDDFVRFLDRQKRAEETSAAEQQQQQQHEAGGEESLGPVKPMKDLSIAEGQKVHIALKVGPNAGSSRARRRPRSDASSKKGGGGGAGGGGLLLAPPPLPGATYKGVGVSGSLPPPPVSPQPAIAPSPSAREKTPSATSGAAAAAGAGTAAEGSGTAATVAPPTTSPKSGTGAEPPDDEAPSAGGGGGGCVDAGGEGGDDDDGWGDFESA